MMPRDAAAEDQCEFVGLTDSAVGVKEPLLKGIDGSATTEDQIVGVLYLGKEQAMLNAGMAALFGSEKRREAGQPLLRTGDHLVGGEGIGEFLKSFRIGTLQEGVGALLKVNATLLQAPGQPVVLIETDAHKQLSPAGVLNIEVVLLDPAPLHLQMPTVVFPDGGHDGGGFAGFDDGHHLIGLRTSEVALHEIIASAGGIFLNGYTPFLSLSFFVSLTASGWEQMGHGNLSSVTVGILLALSSSDSGVVGADFRHVQDRAKSASDCQSTACKDHNRRIFPANSPAFAGNFP